MNRLMRGAEPFFISGGRTGCLLLHGFTGTPFEMKEMGEHLAGRGFTVLAPRLFAHATTQQDLPRARWPDWVASVEDGYRILRGACERVVPLGLSMGGLLTLLAAADLEVAGAVPMSTPVRSPDPRLKLLSPVGPLLTAFWHFTAKGPSDWRDAQAGASHLEYPQYSVRGGLEVHHLIAAVQRRLPEIVCPILIVHSRGDGAVPPAHAQELYDRLGSRQKELLWLENSGHVVTRDAERQRVFQAAADFVEQVSRGPA